MDPPPPAASTTPATGGTNIPGAQANVNVNANANGTIRRGAFRPHHHVQHHPRPPYPTGGNARGGFQPRGGPGGFQRGGFRPAFVPRGRSGAGGRGSFGPGVGGVGIIRPTPQHIPPGSQPLAIPQVARRELKNAVENEETIKNDYALWFALTGRWSADWVKRVEPEEDCKEYPKLRHLIDMKQSQVDQLSHPPFHLTIQPPSHPHPSPNPALSFSSSLSLLSVLPTHTFSSILITPPPMIFAPNNSTTSPHHPAGESGFTYTDLLNLPIRTISSDPSFVFLWVGEASGLGLERGREALLKWGYRRCEEVLWVKTNKKKGSSTLTGGVANAGDGEETKPRNLLVNMKEHCLMGIRGTVRRKTDGWFVHCNVDTDVMVYEQDPDDPNPPAYPPKLTSVIENFCLGTRRLHLFAPKSSARRGWVTVGTDDTVDMAKKASSAPVGRGEELYAGAEAEEQADMSADNQPDEDVPPSQPTALGWDLDAYNDHVRPNEYGQYVLPEIQEIENLRPKSPVRGDRGGRSDPNTPGMAGAGRGPAMGYGTEGGARPVRGGGPRMGTGPRMGAGMGQQNLAHGAHLGSQGAFNGGQAPRGTASLMGGSSGGGERSGPPRFNGAINPLALKSSGINLGANGLPLSSGSAGGIAGYHGGTAFGHQPANSLIPNEMLMAMAMQQLQMQMQLQQQQFALQQQEMYRNLMANQQHPQAQPGAGPSTRGYEGGIGEDEYDGQQQAWKAQGQ